MKLELKHLAPYLPYKLRIKYQERNQVMNMGQGHSLHWIGIKSVLNWQNVNGEPPKPILRPLSDLKDESYHLKLKSWFTSERSVIISVYENEVDFTITSTYFLMGEVFTESIVNRNKITETRHRIVNKLLESHFDVFGLIEKRLAVNINTLNQDNE